MTSANFESSYNKLIANEGGYVNDPNDSGGETYKGVARNKNPDWSGWIIIDLIKKEHGKSAKIINEQAKKNEALQYNIKKFYYDNYWVKACCDIIPSNILDFFVFDLAVNAGVSKSIEILQRAMGLFVDGIAGNITKSKIRGLDTVDDGLTSNDLLDVILNFQGELLLFYRANKQAPRFLNGWVGRVANNSKGAI